MGTQNIIRFSFFLTILLISLVILEASASDISDLPLNGTSEFNSDPAHKRFRRYTTDRTCGYGELCKEEFSYNFRCRCPLWSFCSSPGKYYDAYCTMSGLGYLWTQPTSSSAKDTKTRNKSNQKQKQQGKFPFAGRSYATVQN